MKISVSNRFRFPFTVSKAVKYEGGKSLKMMRKPYLKRLGWFKRLWNGIKVMESASSFPPTKKLLQSFLWLMKKWQESWGLAKIIENCNHKTSSPCDDVWSCGVLRRERSPVWFQWLSVDDGRLQRHFGVLSITMGEEAYQKAELGINKVKCI